MSVSMTEGIKVYKLEIGKQATELFDVFEPTDKANLIATFGEKSCYLR